MNFSDCIRMALKNLSRQKSRTFLTIVAITIGSLSLILMTSLIISIRQSLIAQFKNLGAFNLVSVMKDPNSTDNKSLISSNGDPSEGKKIDNATLATMERIPHVEEATPTVSGMGFSTMHMENSNKKSWANVIAYDPDNDVFNLPIAAGRKLAAGDLDKIVVSGNFAGSVGFSGTSAELIGKKVVLNSKMGGGGSAPDWGPLPAKPPSNADREWYESQGKGGIDITAEIVGVSSNANLDGGANYITLGWAHRLMTTVSWQWGDNKQNCDKQTGEGCNTQPTMKLVKDDRFVSDGYNSIILRADDTANLESIASEVTKLGYGANTAQTMLDEINRILSIIGAVLAAIGGISLFVAGIGIINTMVMATYERIREIGVMRACGATRASIRRLFTVEAGLLGFWGGLFGLLIAIVLIKVAKYFVVNKGGSLGDLPIDQIGSFPWWLIAGVLAFTTLLGMAAGLYPAIKAARLNPVDALRYE